MDTLDRITKSFQLISVAFVILGIFNMHLAYYWYDINIFEYAEAGEILLSFADIVISLVILTALVAFVSFVIPKYNERPAKPLSKPRIRERGPSESEEEYSRVVLGALKKSNRLVNLLFLLPIIIIDALIVFVTWSSDGVFFDGMWFGMILINMLLLPTSVQNFELNENKEIKAKPLDEHNKKAVYVLIFSIVIYLSVRSYTGYSLNLVKPKYEVTLLFKNGKTLVTGPDLIYVHSSKNFVFFKNIQSHKSTIIPKSECARIDIMEIDYPSENIRPKNPPGQPQ